MALSYDEIRQLAVNAGFTGNSADTITAIALSESAGNPGAIHYNDGNTGYNSYGLTQILGIHPNASAALDPQTALNQAYTISKGGTNFSPWTTYTASPNSPNSYLNNLPQSLGGYSSTNIAGGLAPGEGDFGGSGVNDPNAQPAPAGDPNATTSTLAPGEGDFGGGGPVPTPTGTGDSALPYNPNDPSTWSWYGLPNPYNPGTTLDPNAVDPTNPNSPLGALPSGAGGAWWNTATTIIGDYLTRFGVVLLALILIAAGVWALANGGKLRVPMLPKGAHA